MTQQQDVISVVCVDDHAFLLEGLKSRLAAEADIEVSETLEDASQLLLAAARHAPCIVLLDIEMPGFDAFDLTESISRHAEGVQVVLLTAYVRDTYIDAAVNAGAWGYLSKRDTPSEIVDAIRRVAAGEAVFSREVIERCGHDPSQSRNGREDGPRRTSRLAMLTPRETQILRMIGQGMPRNEIARSIHRSPKTVDAHRASIMDKLGLHDRVELARFAIREGLVEL